MGFYFYFAAIAELSASLPRIIFHSPTPNFEKFLLISLARLFVLYADEGDFALSLVLTPSFPHQIIAVWEQVAYSNASKEMQNDEHVDTHKDEKMKAQTTRQTARKTAISNWFKIFIK